MDPSHELRAYQATAAWPRLLEAITTHAKDPLNIYIYLNITYFYFGNMNIVVGREEGTGAARAVGRARVRWSVGRARGEVVWG